LILLGYDRVLEKRFEGPGKVLELFISKRVGNLNNNNTIITIRREREGRGR